MDKIQLYYNPYSRARTIHWMLEEIGVPYELKLIDFKSKETKTKEFLALNPMGKIPTLIHNANVVTEAAAICTYLADAFPEAKLAPAIKDPHRGTYLRWLFFTASCLEAAILDKKYPRKEEVPASSLGYGSYADTVDTIEKAINPGPFILGNQFSAADVYLASGLWWGMMFKGIESRPTFQSYVARCSERPAFKRFEAQTNEIVEQMKK